jgi:RecJ-like exonuclease
MIICSACNGEGRCPPHYDRCVTCDGHGELDPVKLKRQYEEDKYRHEVSNGEHEEEGR